MITETVLEMHYHRPLMELFRSVFGVGAGRINFYKYADLFVVVVEPTVKSMKTALRLGRLEGPRRICAVANKTRTTDDADRIAEATGLEVVGSVPDDDAVASADRNGHAPLDDAPNSAFVQALRSLVKTLVQATPSAVSVNSSGGNP